MDFMKGVRVNINSYDFGPAVGSIVGLSLRWTRWGGGGCDWGRSSLELRQCRISGVNTSG